MDPLANLQFTTSGALIELVDSQFQFPSHPHLGLVNSVLTPALSHPLRAQKRCWCTSETTGN